MFFFISAEQYALFGKIDFFMFLSLKIGHSDREREALLYGVSTIIFYARYKTKK